MTVILIVPHSLAVVWMVWKWRLYRYLKSRDLETVMSPLLYLAANLAPSPRDSTLTHSLTHRPSHIFCAVCVTTCYEMEACFTLYIDEYSNAEESHQDSVSAMKFWVRCISRTANFILILFRVHEKKKPNEAKVKLSLWPSNTPWNGDWQPHRNSKQIPLGEIGVYVLD
jgi:hypothetical protein